MDEFKNKTVYILTATAGAGHLMGCCRCTILCICKWNL